MVFAYCQNVDSEYVLIHVCVFQGTNQAAFPTAAPP